MKPLIITAKESSVNYLSEVWQYRELLWAFMVRDLKLRYKQTVLGVLWVILQPLLSATVLTFIFGGLFQMGEQVAGLGDAAGTGTQIIPYALFVFIGLVFWNFFSDGLNQGANSLINQSQLIKKIYFPRLIAPLSCLATAGVNFCLNLLVLWLGIAAFGFGWSWWFLLLLPLLLLIMALTTAGASFFLAALNLKYRDVKQALPFLIQILLFLAPVIYPVSILPSSWAWLAYLNPLTAVITVARWAILQTALPITPELWLSFFSCLIIFGLGFWYFRHTERFFADIA